MLCSKKPQDEPDESRPRLTKLTVEQVEQIDRLLASLGDYGEIHLIVQRGELKYINKVESQRAWKDEKSD
jgi:hypothetical protein